MIRALSARITRVEYARAARIRAVERDRALGIESTAWPTTAPPDWTSSNGTLRRIIVNDKAERIPAELEEAILRFPSAPMHGFHRVHEHHVSLGPSENFHTLRILRSANARHRREPISRIFLMNTGLNERDTMGHYYWLASLLVNEQPTTACVIRPFPGHLTRYPFQAFAETPLDNYLRDGSHLFRQFLRFMIETQWFLSAIVRRSSYRCASGANLLGECDDLEKSRLNPEHLAAEIQADWLRLHSISVETAAREAARDDQPYRPPVSDPLEDVGQFLDSVRSLRQALNLDRDFASYSGTLDSTSPEDEPKVHVLGYSLGGFTAQSIFMSWPFLIASCSTVLAGGALRELAPTVFADPEEWQTVLHSLRYELDDRFMSQQLSPDDHHVAGVDREFFTYLKRTFYEVFQQEYRGSIQTRYEAFRERMLFIVGGNDPVVRPESVLQSGPKGGLNLLEIGGLSHFLEGSGSDDSEQRQRSFWLPEMAVLIHRFANNAAREQDDQRPLTWFDPKLAKPHLSRTAWRAATSPSKNGKILLADSETGTSTTDLLQPLAPSELVEIEREGGLPERLFERCLDDLIHRNLHEATGILFILRNELPSVLLDDLAVRETASALYHDDLNIVAYCHGVTARRDVITSKIGATCMVLPWNARSVMAKIDGQRGFPSQAESAGGGVMQRATAEDLWKSSLKHCKALVERKDGRQSLRRFDGNTELPLDDENLERILGHARHYAGHESFPTIPSLPDCWIWIAKDLLVKSRHAKLDVARGVRELPTVIADVCESNEAVLDEIRNDRIRIVSVSRARFNPRFRGRLIVDAKAARKVLIHATLCVALSEPVVTDGLMTAFS